MHFTPSPPRATRGSTRCARRSSSRSKARPRSRCSRASSRSIDALERFRIKTEEATYLKEAGAISSEPARKIDGARFTCDVDAVPEGSLVCAGQPVLTIEGPFWQAQLVAAWALSSIDGATQVADPDFAQRDRRGRRGDHRERRGPPRPPRRKRAPRARRVRRRRRRDDARARGPSLRRSRARAQPPSFVLAAKDEQSAFESWLRAVPEQPIVRIDVRNALDGIDKVVAAARAKATASWSDAPIAIEMDAKRGPRRMALRLRALREGRLEGARHRRLRREDARANRGSPPRGRADRRVRGRAPRRARFLARATTSSRSSKADSGRPACRSARRPARAAFPRARSSFATSTPMVTPWVTSRTRRTSATPPRRKPSSSTCAPASRRACARLHRARRSFAT